jgi:GTP-binding protein
MAGKFIKSAADFEGCPPPKLAEIGIVGRSNSGKSTLINAISKQKNLAKTSQTPGKTQLLNFFDIDGKYVLVDMPGYGYAARSQEQKSAWSPMIEQYLQYRDNLAIVILVMDVNRAWSQDEQNLVEWLANFGLPVVLAVNKCEKLNQSQKVAKSREFAEIDCVAATVFVSAEQRIGIDELMRTVFENQRQS